jgi:peptidoglycan biosynthesis protein MviN/MurJ (putative lipid II flippase)
VAAVLAGLSAGLIPAAAAKVLQQGLFATGRGRDAVRAGTLGIAATVAGAFVLQRALGPAGLGLGVAAGLAVQAASLARAATEAGLWRPDRRLGVQAARAAGASLAMAAALAGIGGALGPVEPGLPGVPALAALVVAGLAAYGAAAAGLGALRGLKGLGAP